MSKSKLSECEKGYRRWISPKQSGVKIQDCGPSKKAGQVPVYHTHGLRQYMGTCKIHKFSTCRHLTNWKPGSGLGKTIMREWEDDYSKVPEHARCLTCFTNSRTSHY